MWIPILRAIAANLVVLFAAFGFGTSIVRLLPDSFSQQTKSICALIGLYEPTGDWNIDSVAYHLLGSKVWVRNGIVAPIPDNMSTSYPCDVEMVFAALYAFGGDRAAGFSSVWTIPLLLAIAASLGRRCGLDSKGAWWIAALIITMPTVYHAGTGAFIDVIYAAFVVAAVRVGLDAQEKRHFVAFGLFCGLAMATKYPGLVALPALVFCAAWRPERGRALRAMMPNAALAAAAACLVASPMYLNNWIFLGTPIYPPPAWVTHFLNVKYFPVDALREFYAYSISRGNGRGRGLIHFFTL